jgi:hypothetical protein
MSKLSTFRIYFEALPNDSMMFAGVAVNIENRHLAELQRVIEKSREAITLCVTLVAVSK